MITSVLQTSTYRSQLTLKKYVDTFAFICTLDTCNFSVGNFSFFSTFGKLLFCCSLDNFTQIIIP